MSGEYEDAGVENRPLLECGTEGSVQAVLEVELTLPLDAVREEVAEERRVVGEQAPQVQRALRRDELTELDHAWGDVGPVLCRDEPVVGIGTGVADGLENHPATIGRVAWLECPRDRRTG